MLTLGLIARNEAPMLRLTLPTYAPWFRRKLLLDTGSTDDTVGIATTHGFGVESAPWRNDFSAARNYLLNWATGDRADNEWMLQLDADEAMFPCDLLRLVALCDIVGGDVIALPRINLADGGRLQCTDNYPDWQARCVRLGSKARWEQPVHEVIKAPPFQASGPAIYHYGWCKSPRQCWLRSHNYRMIAEGGPLLTEAPAWVSDDPARWLADMRERHTFVPFTGMHPLRGLI